MFYLLDILDNETIAAKIGLDIEEIKVLREILKAYPIFYKKI